MALLFSPCLYTMLIVCETSLQLYGNVETASPLFILCVLVPLIVETPNYTFISASTVVMGVVISPQICTRTMMNAYSDRIELVIVAGKCLQMPMSKMNVLYS